MGFFDDQDRRDAGYHCASDDWRHGMSIEAMHGAAEIGCEPWKEGYKTRLREIEEQQRGTTMNQNQKETPPLMAERIYVAIGGHGWGKGLSAAEAKRSARRYCKRGTRLDVYRLPEGAHSARVDGLGGLRWTFQPGADNTAQPELVERKGRPVEPSEPEPDSDPEGIAAWQDHVAEIKAQLASAKEQRS